jgi:uncharacterized protein YjbI with pentapeptide repeats
LRDATVDHADLDGADLLEANLENADLSGTDLHNVRWENIQSAKMANLRGVKNAPAEFVTWALQHSVVQSGGSAESAKVRLTGNR